MRKPLAEGEPVQHAHGAHQEHDADNNQHDRAGKGVMPARRRTLYWIQRASHFAPHWTTTAAEEFRLG